MIRLYFLQINQGALQSPTKQAFQQLKTLSNHNDINAVEFCVIVIIGFCAIVFISFCVIIIIIDFCGIVFLTCVIVTNRFCIIDITFSLLLFYSLFFLMFFFQYFFYLPFFHNLFNLVIFRK